MIDDYATLSPRKILSMPWKVEYVERFNEYRRDRLCDSESSSLEGDEEIDKRANDMEEKQKYSALVKSPSASSYISIGDVLEDLPTSTENCETKGKSISISSNYWKGGERGEKRKDESANFSLCNCGSYCAPRSQLTAYSDSSKYSSNGIISREDSSNRVLNRTQNDRQSLVEDTQYLLPKDDESKVHIWEATNDAAQTISTPSESSFAFSFSALQNDAASIEGYGLHKIKKENLAESVDTKGEVDVIVKESQNDLKSNVRNNMSDILKRASQSKLFEKYSNLKIESTISTNTIPRRRNFTKCERTFLKKRNVHRSASTYTAINRDKL